MTIVIDEKMCSGSPTIKGKRLTVLNVVLKVEDYQENLNALMIDFELSKNEILQANLYCKNLNCLNDSYLINFCSGCVFREKNAYDIKKDELIRSKNINTINALVEKTEGIKGWEIAKLNYDYYLNPEYFEW